MPTSTHNSTLNFTPDREHCFLDGDEDASPHGGVVSLYEPFAMITVQDHYSLSRDRFRPATSDHKRSWT